MARGHAPWHEAGTRPPSLAPSAPVPSWSGVGLAPTCLRALRVGPPAEAAQAVFPWRGQRAHRRRAGGRTLALAHSRTANGARSPPPSLAHPFAKRERPCVGGTQRAPEHFKPVCHVEASGQRAGGARAGGVRQSTPHRVGLARSHSKLVSQLLSQQACWPLGGTPRRLQTRSSIAHGRFDGTDHDKRCSGLLEHLKPQRGADHKRLVCP